MNDRPDNRIEPGSLLDEKLLTDNRDRYIDQSAATTVERGVAELPPRAPLFDPVKVAEQLAAMCRSQLPAIAGDAHETP